MSGDAQEDSTRLGTEITVPSLILNTLSSDHADKNQVDETSVIGDHIERTHNTTDANPTYQDAVGALTQSRALTLLDTATDREYNNHQTNSNNGHQSTPDHNKRISDIHLSTLDSNSHQITPVRGKEVSDKAQEPSFFKVVAAILDSQIAASELNLGIISNGLSLRPLSQPLCA